MAYTRRSVRRPWLQPGFEQKDETALAIGGIVVGGLYAIRDPDGTCRIVKVLVVDEFAVHLRRCANRFKELPDQVTSSGLSLGGLDSPEGPALGISRWRGRPSTTSSASLSGANR